MYPIACFFVCTFIYQTRQLPTWCTHRGVAILAGDII